MVRNLLILFMFLFFSCTSKRNLSAKELRAYLIEPENGVSRSVEQAGITMRMTYRPIDLILLQEISAADEEGWSQAEMGYDSLDYFLFQMSENGREIERQYNGAEDFAEASKYLRKDLANDITMKLGGERLKPISVLHVPSFGTSTATNVLLTFKSDLKETSGDVSIVYTDSFFGSGQTVYEFEIDDIKKIPRLKHN